MSLKTQAKVLRALQEQVVEPVGGAASVRGRRARAGGDQQGSADRDPRRAVPRGPLLPAQRHPDLRAAAARSRTTTSRCWPSTSWPSSRASTAAGRSSFDAGAATGLQQLPLAGQRPRAAQRDRAADDHGAGRHDHAARDLAFLDGAASRRSETLGRRPLPLHDAREQFERDYILRALAAQQGNISRTADALGVERSNLYRKMRAFGIVAGAPRKKKRSDEPRRRKSDKSRRVRLRLLERSLVSRSDLSSLELVLEDLIEPNRRAAGSTPRLT